MHLILGEAKVLRQIPGIRHRILGKHIESGVGAIFFDGQDACHVGQCHVGLILEPCTKEVQILLLGFGVVGVLAEEAVPFVNQDDKGAVGLRIDIHHDLNEIIRIKIEQVTILCPKLHGNILLQTLQHSIYRGRTAEKFLHVDPDHIILIQMLPIRCIPGNLQPIEQRGGVLA